MRFIQLIFVLFAFLVSLMAQTQENKPNSLNLGMNIESFASIEMEYQWNNCKLSNKIHPFVKAKLPVLLYIQKKEISAFEFQAGADYSILNNPKFVLVNRTYLSAAYQKQILGKFVPVDFYADINPSYRFKNGTLVGVKLGVKQNIFTHIEHAEYVKERYRQIVATDGNEINNMPINGFYASTSTMIYSGLTAKFNINPKCDFSFDLLFVNRPFSIVGFMDGTKYGFVPFYLNIKLFYNI